VCSRRSSKATAQRRGAPSLPAFGKGGRTDTPRTHGNSLETVLPRPIAYHDQRMNKTSTVAIVGTGNVAKAMAVALHNSKVRVTEIIGRDAKKTAKLAHKAKARASNMTNAIIDAQLIYICVSDAAIAEVARKLSKLPVDWKGKSVVHVSGALTAAELSPLKKRGAATASFHPMNTFVPGANDELSGTPFGAEGDERAIRVAT